MNFLAKITIYDVIVTSLALIICLIWTFTFAHDKNFAIIVFIIAALIGLIIGLYLRDRDEREKE